MGDIKKQGIQNAAIANVAIVVGFVSTLVIQPYFLKPEEIGLVKILYSWSVLISTLIPLGMVNVVYKFFPQFRNKEKKHHGFFTFIIIVPLVGFIFVSLIVLLFRGMIIGAYANKSALLIEFFDYVFPLSFFLAFISVLSVYSASLFKSSFPTFLTEITTKVFPVFVISAYYLKWIEINQFVFLYMLCFAVIFLMLFIYICFIDRPFSPIDKTMFTGIKVREIIGYSAMFALGPFASQGMKMLDTPILGWFLPLALVGIYGTVAIIPAVIEMPLHALEKIAAAKISDAFTHSRVNEVKNIYYRSSKYLFLAGGLLFLGVNLNIHKLLWLLPKEKGFWQAENVVYIISFGTLFNMATSVNNPILYNSKYYRHGLALLAFLIIFSCINYFIFIPLWGLEGAAFATVLSSCSYNFLKFFFIWKKMELQPFDISSLKTLLLIAVCGLLWFLNPVIDLGSATIEIAVMSLIIAAFYLAGAYYLNIVPELFASKNVDEIKKRLGF